MDIKYKWERHTASGKASPYPVDVSSIIIMPTAAAAAIVKLYDGNSAGDPLIMTITTATSESKVISFEPPLHTQRGLYIVFTSGCDEVLVAYGSGKE